MTKDDILKLKSATIVLADGRMGTLVRWPAGVLTTIGIQVAGEQEMRHVPIDAVIDCGNGALWEAYGVARSITEGEEAK